MIWSGKRVRADQPVLQEALRPNTVEGSQPDELPKYSVHAHQPFVTYEIHLHPTYSIPTLWFTLHDLPMGEPTFDLDSVYRYLVPDEFKSRLRGTGATGGISAAVSDCQLIHGIPNVGNTFGSRIHLRTFHHSLSIHVRPKRPWRTSTAQLPIILWCGSAWLEVVLGCGCLIN
jgi:hypothetical protein